jgi:uracil-DNA glycosylase family 4
MSWDDEFFNCPICGKDGIVPAWGNKKSPILIIGAYPGDDEILKGRPFVGGTGELFRKELAYVGIDMYRLRLCNLWQHKAWKNQKHKYYFECLKDGAEKTIAEAKGKQAILLVGASTVKYFVGMPVSDVAGLQVKSDYLSAPIIMAMHNPAQAFHGAIGEVRLSIQKFAKLVNHLL